MNNIRRGNVTVVNGHQVAVTWLNSTWPLIFFFSFSTSETPEFETPR